MFLLYISVFNLLNNCQTPKFHEKNELQCTFLESSSVIFRKTQCAQGIVDSLVILINYSVRLKLSKNIYSFCFRHIADYNRCN